MAPTHVRRASFGDESPSVKLSAPRGQSVPEPLSGTYPPTHSPARTLAPTPVLIVQRIYRHRLPRPYRSSLPVSRRRVRQLPLPGWLKASYDLFSGWKGEGEGGPYRHDIDPNRSGRDSSGQKQLSPRDGRARMPFAEKGEYGAGRP